LATVEIAIPPRSVYVGVVRLALSSLARATGLDEERVDDLKIAASEALTNAVLANERAASQEPVTISWFEDENRIELEVSDRGAALPVSSPEDTDTVTVRASLSRALLESLVDECEIGPRDGGGTRTFLAVKL
jgi:serine/threonine-protein kinase RsbW